MRIILLSVLILVSFLPAAQPGSDVCSQIAHDRYTATGPDGQQYPTWHPQYDLNNNCSFDHEHGSNPSLLRPVAANKIDAKLPLYGYTAGRMGMPEGHNGFKTYVLPVGNHRMMITQHQGTSDALKAACLRFHTLDIVVVDLSGNILVDQHLMADFGKSVVNKTQAPLTPAACPNQAQNTAGSNGIRQFPSMADGNIGYEPWRVHNGCNVFGFCSGALTFNTVDPQTAVDSAAATANVRRYATYDATQPTRGTFRFVAYNAGQLKWTGTITGTFYTDGHGNNMVAPETAGSVVQFIAKAVAIADIPIGGHCYPYDPFVYNYWCAPVNSDTMPFLKNPLITGAN